jgi:cell wall-associated NlpC family hydrolase
VARARYYTTQKTRYRNGSYGPTYFDCTGLVYRVFVDCSALALIGARGEQGVENYLDWFTARQQADMEPPQPGDLIVYGPGFAHIGIYVGAGKAISTLSSGVREHSATKLRTSANGQLMPVCAYLHLKEK